ncbi:MAG: hypothetical protein NTZ67_03270 [Gammaproteobacteria bacterium]|nr:hypothetical protein [Gammaproteobacteria bacterium]
MRTAPDKLSVIQDLQATFDALRKIDPAHYISIKENLYVTLLYAAVIDQRNKTCVTENSTSDALTEMLQQDKKSRCHFYRLPKDDLTACLQLLNLEALQKLLDLSVNPNELSQQLKNMRETRYQQLILWEIQIQKLIIARKKAGFPYFKMKTKELGGFIYQYSLIGMGGEFSLLLGTVLTRKPAAHIAAIYFKKIFLRCIQCAVFRATTSQEKAEYVAVFISQYLTERNTLILFKTTGILVGFFYTYYSGMMSLLRLLSMNLVACHLSEGVIDDLNARVVNYALPFDPTYTFCFRMMIMMSALLETIYVKSARPCIQALISMIGSIVAMRVGQGAIAKSSDQMPTPEKVLFLFILSNVGYLFSEFLSGAGMAIIDNIQEKTHVRDSVIEVLREREKKGELTDLRIKTPSLLTPSLLWFDKENPLEMSWRNVNSGRVFRTQCEITSSVQSNLPHTVLCDPVVSVSTLS